MATEELTTDLLEIMKMIKEKGGTDCSGTCHHRRPGEFHCHVFGPLLKISSQGVKNRILKLLRMGLLQRNRIVQEQGFPLTKFTVSPEGEKVLSANAHRLTERNS